VYSMMAHLVAASGALAGVVAGFRRSAAALARAWREYAAGREHTESVAPAGRDLP
jgi:hypothetical protein